MATELELAASEISGCEGHAETVAGLRGQAGMARLLADLDACPETRRPAAS